VASREALVALVMPDKEYNDPSSYYDDCQFYRTVNGGAMDEFRNNLIRLLGLHGLTSREAAQILGLSESTVGKWGTGLRQPSFATALRVGEFFGIPADRLATAEFPDLLQHELADPERFHAVETRIHHARAGLRPVQDLEAGKEVDVVTGKPVNRKRADRSKGPKRRKVR
jgi:transcriptional regulator with XRE-family HTH domain